jgi:hypothetical protein
VDFILACKVFFKALKDEKGAKNYLAGSQADAPISSEEHAHLRLLALLQKEGRLIDFFKEDISNFTDTQIGAAVRKIHNECGKTLEEFVTLRPLFKEAEGASVTVQQGYDAQAIKVIGKVKGNPPYQGVLRHKGWKAHKLSLPKPVNKADSAVVCPAEIEIT